MRSIDADKISEELERVKNSLMEMGLGEAETIHTMTGLNMAQLSIAIIPTIEATPVVHGRWEWDTEDIYKCSNCAEKSHVKEVMGHPDWDYCPNCGAMMDGGVSDG